MKRFLVALTATATATVASVPAQVMVSYDVEFETTGPWELRGCPAAGGSDKLTGKINGIEPISSGEDNVYTGTLTRVTKVDYCTSRTLPSGEGADCLISINGSGPFAVELKVEAYARGGWLKVKRTGMMLVSRVTGACDPGEMVQLQIDYGSGETAGSPNGQPIAVAVLDSLRVKTYPPNRAANEDWTLTVKRRLP